MAVKPTRGGSSPRMRGKLGPLNPKRRAPRLIPAYAGKTRAIVFRPVLRRAHPRVCGENLTVNENGEISGGSSPRMRGKRHGGRRKLSRDRLIPAYAGKTWCGIRPRRTERAHPRVCGENITGRRDLDIAPGSSPRMRGKHAAKKGASTISGLIPAYAGKTLNDLEF